MEIIRNRQDNQEGFALLISIIVVGVILSVGITILDLSIKQVKLSTNSRSSEVAFHAANAGAECARYWRRTKSDINLSDDMVRGIDISPTCFGVNPEGGNPISPTEITGSDVAGGGQVFQYEYDFEWGASTRCMQINTIVFSSDISGGGLTLSNMNTYVPGYSDGNTFPCDAGSQCTVIAVSGYNRPCSSATGFGSVQREVLIQF